MQSLSIRQRAVAHFLAAIVTFANAATLSALMPQEQPAPASRLAATDAGCDFNPKRPC